MKRCWSGRCTIDMEQEFETLDEMEYLLERMLELAVRSAGDGCGDKQRRDLQKGFEVLRGLLDETAQRYERGRRAE